MKKAVVILALASFTALAVFSVFAMTTESGHGYGCIAETARGTECPYAKSSFSFLNFHLGVFKTFSTAVFGSGFSAAILLSITLLALFAAGLGFVFNDLPGGNSLALAESLTPFVSASQLKSLSWLSFHENSPSF